MGRKERRVHEQQELKQSILDAAREIALAEGWRNVTMRKIAERIEYSHAAIYDYFANKDVLFLELIRQGFHILQTKLEAIQAKNDDPVETLRHIGQGYLTFAWRYPELYRIMYGLDGATFNVTPVYDEGKQIEDIVADAIRKVLESHGWSTNHLYESVYALWSTAHGLVALALANQVPGGEQQAMKLFEHTLQDALLAWEHNPANPS